MWSAILTIIGLGLEVASFVYTIYAKRYLLPPTLSKKKLVKRRINAITGKTDQDKLVSEAIDMYISLILLSGGVVLQGIAAILPYLGSILRSLQS